jgi:uncharacterized membrane protein YqaE (UPF0057 family)
MNSLIRAILAIIIPPLTVYLTKGTGKYLMANIILCLLFYVPGMLHALWVVFKYGTSPFHQVQQI